MRKLSLSLCLYKEIATFAHTMLHLHQVAIGYPSRPLADSIDASLLPATLTALVGRNGSGKSTLLRTLAALLPPLSGMMSIKGCDLNALSPQQRARHIALVLTDRIDAPALTAGELVEMGRLPYASYFGKLDDTDRETVETAAEYCRIKPLWKREVGSLSDGERQRIMIARALAQDTPCILLDEPTAFLDFPAKVEILDLLLRIAHERRKAILLSTHDLEITLRAVDRLWLLSPDRLMEGTPDTLAQSDDLARIFTAPHLHFHPSTLRFSYTP